MPSSFEIVYAGGTISSLMTAQGHLEGGHAVNLMERLHQVVPEAIADVDITGSDFAYLGLSENMDAEYWATITQKVSAALDRSPRALIVTHGTDSMEQTARHLKSTFAHRLSKQKSSIILTGANRDIADPQTDAWSNLQCALDAGKSNLKPGVYIAFHNRIIPADEAVKEPFDGIEMNYISKNSPEYQLLKSRREQHEASLIARLREVFSGREYDPSRVREYPVNKVCDNHDQLLSFLERHPQVRAVLLILYHSGTANTENPRSSVAILVQKLREKGIVLFGVTENGEPVDLHSYETSVKLRQAGVVPLYDITQAVAREKLSYLAHLKPAAMIQAMLENTVGERTQPVPTSDIKALLQLYTPTM